MARKPRDYAAEHAARTRPGRVIRRGKFAGGVVGVTVPVRVGTGHAVPPHVAQLASEYERSVIGAPLPRLRARATADERAAREAMIDRRRRMRHLVALRREALTGEHRVGGYRERPTAPMGGEVGGYFWQHYAATFTSLRRLAGVIARLPPDQGVHLVGFGDLAEGYSADYRGTRGQWRSFAYGLASGPLVGAGGMGEWPAWTAGAITDAAAAVFDALELVELRLVT